MAKNQELPRTIRAHRLKCWPRYFYPTRDRKKTGELRMADRDFQVGDYLLLEEYEPADGKSGQYMWLLITHLLQADDPPFGLKPGFVLISFEHCPVREYSLLASAEKSGAITWLEPEA